ncbi:hypothetical protein KDA_06400 [Dictyobacter alpinus]|uniref:F5/8 type C domain-containing protein n=1 Tax=Dictyobacter alpinus TaxID=2014873 RepID=A0A402B1D2_9CHLR|nr:discoidin domain-containing protein [Dictyobacter alpinus]GCE25156.1 hypothetical protein KDA_06400 [Dictyobacter alpinus]
MKRYHPSRKHIYQILLLLVLLGSSIGTITQTKQAHADSPNLVQNGGFEDGLTPWYDFGGTAQTSSSVTHSGKGALVMGTGQQGAGQSLTLDPNTIYSFSGWGKTTGTGEYAQITLRIVDGSGGQVDYQMPFTLSDWTRQARTITTPATISSAIIYILKNAGSGYFYADDVFVGKGRDAEAWPFATESIWNTPIGSNATYTSVPFQLESAYIYDGEPLVSTDANAPQRAAYTAGSTGANDFGQCNLDPAQGSVGISQGSLQLPDSFILDNWTRNPNFTPNNASGIIQGDGRTMAQFQPTTRCTTGGPIFGYRTTDLDLYGAGIGGGHYGSGLSSTGGGIKPGELIGPGSIGHALQLDFWLEKNASKNPSFRWPADRADYGAETNYCSQDPCKSNPAAFASFKPGSLLAITPSTTPESLGIKTAAGLKIFHALQDYGGYIVDDTGWYFQGLGADYGVDAEMQSKYGYGFNTSSSATGGALDWYNDLNSIFSKLQVIDNNSPTTIGGGGTPRVAPAPDFATTPPPAPVALDRTHWKITSSLNNADANKVLDNNANTYWNSGQAQSSGQDIIVDLGASQTFNQISLDATADFARFPQGYEVDVSNDQTNWTQVFGGGGSGTSPSLGTFPAQTARYVKIQLTGGSISNQSWSVGELNLYTSANDVALNRSGWTVSANGTAGGTSPQLAIDGNATTGWTSAQGQSNHNAFQIDLGSTHTFRKLVLDDSSFPDNYPRGYLIFVSNTPNSWGNVVAACDNCTSDAVQSYTFPAQTDRYITIQETQTNTHPWSIGELTIYS